MTEIACSVVLTVSVGLLVHSFWRVIHVDPGFQPRSLLRVYLRTNYYTEKGRPFWKNVLTETSSLPGVRFAALSDWRPGRDAAAATFVFEERPNDPTRLPTGEGSWISADFFQTVGTPLIAGRFFTEHDDEKAPSVVIINTEAARQFWPGQDPIGKRIGINYTGPGRRSDAAPRLREDRRCGRQHSPRLAHAPAAPAIYMPYLQDETNHDMATMSLFLRTSGNVMALADSVRNRIHTVAPAQPVQNIQDVEDLVSQSVATRRYTLILVGVFAGVGLLLAAVGVYGVISYATSQRTREFGIRMALGATRGCVMSYVLRATMVLTILGSLVGVVVAILLSHSLSSLLFEVNPLDLLSFLLPSRYSHWYRLAHLFCQPGAPRGSIRSSRCRTNNAATNNRGSNGVARTVDGGSREFVVGRNIKFRQGTSAAQIVDVNCSMSAVEWDCSKRMSSHTVKHAKITPLLR